MKHFISKDKLAVLLFVAMIAIIASTALYSWMNNPIRFPGAPEYWSITRNEIFQFRAFNYAEDKCGANGKYGYFRSPRNKKEFHADIDLVARMKLYNMISDFERAPAEVRKLAIDDRDKSIGFAFNTRGVPLLIYSFQDDIMAVKSELKPNEIFYYSVDPQKHLELINYYIAMTEKKFPDTYV